MPVASYRWCGVWCVWWQLASSGTIPQNAGRSQILHLCLLQNEWLQILEWSAGQNLARQDETEHSWATQTLLSSSNWGSILRECPTRSPGCCYPAGLPQDWCPWPGPYGTWVVPFLLPKIVSLGTPLAPADLLRVFKCGCSSNRPCAMKRSSCKANGLRCTIFCHCRGEDDCHNK